MVKLKGKKIQKRNKQKKYVAIYQYLLNHNDGLLFLTENLTSNIVLNELIDFKLINCHIEGNIG